MDFQEIRVLSYGKFARELLERYLSFTVTGITSRGIFLTAGQEEILFLSSGPFHGPITVNISRSCTGIVTGSTVQFSNNRLYFPNGESITGFENSPTWWLTEPEGSLLSTELIFTRMLAAAELLVSDHEPFGLGSLLFPLFGAAEKHPYDPLLSDLLCRILALSKTGNDHLVAEAVSQLLGRGRGLTPSGDDVLSGLLYGVHRLAGFIDKNESIQPVLLARWNKFSGRVVDLARARTTRLSAALLACAARGQVDERLAEAFDGIVRGSRTIGQCAVLLRSWGSTSGGDALVGMAMAVLMMNENEKDQA
jgi:hypothetical protein